jgi:tRNA(Ile)-lysidine synthase
MRETRERLAGRGRLLLAVSGGLDSMTLLDVVARVAAPALVTVATYDHGSGPHARRATARVERVCTRLGLACTVGRANRPLAGEAEWRDARWRFLRGVAASSAAHVVTGHTRDDQYETVVMRMLRGAGARGLAGLDTDTDVVRPFLRLTRDSIARYARARRLGVEADPTNNSRAHLRNRLRLDLLPALHHVRPEFQDDVLRLADMAARWRRDVEVLVSTFPHDLSPDGLAVDREIFDGHDRAGLSVLGPAIAARAGITLDRRGTDRLSAFLLHGHPGARIQLSGGAEVVRVRGQLVFRRAPARVAAGVQVPLADGLEVGRWRFRRSRDVEARSGSWVATLPGRSPLTVRAWQPGDRVTARDGDPPRRVKRFFRDERIPGTDRVGWPVVLADLEIAWVPGVCVGSLCRRAAAETEAPRERYVCERIG